MSILRESKLGGVNLTTTSQLTVFFDQAFYRGVFERTINGHYQAAKVTFGTQPPTYNQIQSMIAGRWSTLTWASGDQTTALASSAQSAQQRKRQARQAIRGRGSSQQAEQVLKLAHKQNLVLKKKRRKETKQAHALKVRLKKQEKHLAKHRGH
jgi:hypothetical protein